MEWYFVFCFLALTGALYVMLTAYPAVASFWDFHSAPFYDYFNDILGKYSIYSNRFSFVVAYIWSFSGHFVWLLVQWWIFQEVFFKIEWISDFELMVNWINRVQNHRIVTRCTWQKKTMGCEEVIEEKEKSGWLGGTFAQPGFIFTGSGHILFRKPDDSPARKFQLFLVERKGRMKQITKGEEEVTFIIKANFRCVGGCGMILHPEAQAIISRRSRGHYIYWHWA